MSDYLVPFGFGEDEFVEKKSRFIGSVFLCETEEEALTNLDRVKKRFEDASHVAFAYSVKATNSIRFSDAGEPQGTAGMPIYEVFRREGIENYLCCVTRYFGGTLLGAGGLTRAYARAAKLGLDAAGIAVMKPVKIISFRCEYPVFELIKLEIDSVGGTIEAIEYGADIHIGMRIPEGNFTSFAGKLGELSSGRIHITEEGVRYLPVRIR